ncbi:MAG TPA: LysR family transcriptional regulator [Solirubrobacteraceae bacterium]|jgi:DNA-binding transcriptional LysR family regulator|nr:LysR family transcriptional regulator [Solirubrobacteraceae bacterium]
MELRQLRAFVAIAEEGTFTAASDRLVLVQSAVSATIRALERELGTPLFERTTRRVALTDAGRALLPEARATLEASRLAVDAVDQVKGGVRGTVSIGIMQATASHAVSVPRLIAGFQAEHPLVTVTVRHVGGSENIAAHVREGSLDLGILSLPGEASGLELTELGREPMLLACPPGHALAQRASVSLAELADEPFVDGPPGWGIRTVTDDVFAAAGVSKTPRFEINDSVSIVQFVAEGLAVALLPPSIAQSSPTVRLVPLKGVVPVFRTVLGVPTGRRLRAAVRAFAEFVLADLESGARH